MKMLVSSLMAAAAIAAMAVPANTAEDHVLLPAQEIKWGKGPASLPAGAEAVVLYGDPGKEGLFALRLKLPKDYHIPAHSHPKPEIVTVISGNFMLGMGDTADQAKTTPLAPGSFFAFSPGMTHFVYTGEETVVQLNSTGPWAINYVNPKDDPRNKN